MGIFTTIFGAMIAGVFGLMGEDQQTQDLRRAEGKAENWANIEREDDLKWKSTQEKMGKAQLRFQKQEAGLGRKERSVQRGLDTRQQGRQNVMNLINTQDSMKNNFLNRMRRAA